MEDRQREYQRRAVRHLRQQFPTAPHPLTAVFRAELHHHLLTDRALVGTPFRSGPANPTHQLLEPPRQAITNHTAVVATVAQSTAPGRQYRDLGLAFGDSAYYAAVVTQADGDKMITAPIWYRRGPVRVVGGGCRR